MSLKPKDETSMDQPLFGETRRRDKVINIVIAIVTAIFVGLTVVMGIISSVFLKGNKCLRVQQKNTPFCIYWVDLILCAIIIMLLVPQILVAYWYRRGELEPKFRRLIYYNAVVTMLLCACANLYFLQVSLHGVPPPIEPPSSSLS